MKNALIILTTIAVLLGITATFVVFYNSGAHETPGELVIPSSSSIASIAATTTAFAVPGLDGTASTTTSSTDANAPSFISSYSAPYPLQWSEGQATLAITGATVKGDQLIFAVAVQMGGSQECVPMNMRLVVDESGDLATPNPQQFTFPDTQSCNGTADATYDNQIVSFGVDGNLTAPYLLTTGGTSKIFFEVATTTDGGVSVTLPATTD
jgi:hypothetical protein